MTIREYTLTAEVLPQDVAVRGVYLPAPHHSSSFSNYDNARKSIELMADLNFNCLFVCVWANSKIAWDSEVLMANSTYASASAANMYADYKGGSGDALKDIISLAHEKDIKVILWFEYGFMHKIGEPIITIRYLQSILTGSASETTESHLTITELTSILTHTILRSRSSCLH